MQRPGGAPGEILIVDNIGLKLEQQQQHYPGCIINAGGEAFDNIPERQFASKAVRRRGPFVAEEEIGVVSQERVDGPFEKQKDIVAVNGQNGLLLLIKGFCRDRGCPEHRSPPQSVSEMIIKHPKFHHRPAEYMLPGDNDRLDLGKHIKLLKRAGNSVRHNLPGQVGNIEAMP